MTLRILADNDDYTYIISCYVTKRKTQNEQNFAYTPNSKGDKGYGRKKAK